MDSQPVKCSICRHVKINGRRCQSPAIAGSAFCFYHRTLHRSHRSAAKSRPAPLLPETVQYLLDNGQNPESFAPSPDFVLPPIEDAESIQLAVSLLVAAIINHQIDPTDARNLLYSLQIASSNVRTLALASAPTDDRDTFVRRVVRTASGQILAAPGDDNGVPAQSASQKSALEFFLEERCSDPTTPPPAPTADTEGGLDPVVAAQVVDS